MQVCDMDDWARNDTQIGAEQLAGMNALQGPAPSDQQVSILQAHQMHVCTIMSCCTMTMRTC